MTFDKEEVKRLLQACLDTGELTEEFAEVAMEIGRTQIFKAKGKPRAALEDALGDFARKVVTKWQMIKVDGNPISYMNSMAWTSLMDIMRKYDRNRIKMNLLEEEKKDERKLDNFDYGTEGILKEVGFQDARKAEAKTMEILRLEGIQRLKAGEPVRDIAKFLGVGKSTVQRWRKRKTVVDLRKGNGRKKGECWKNKEVEG